MGALLSSSRQTPFQRAKSFCHSSKPPSSSPDPLTHFIEQDAYQWNTLLRRFLNENIPRKAILTFAEIIRRGAQPDGYTILFVVKACSLLKPSHSEANQTHAQVLKLGFGSEIIIRTALLRMYSQLGDLVAAQKLFDETPERDIIQWNALIASYAQQNQPHSALLATCRMMNQNTRPDEVTLVSIVSACSQLKSLAIGKLAHGYAIKNLMGFDTFVHNSVIDMYAKCGCMYYARRLFAKMGSKNVVSWTSMINACSDANCLQEALGLFKEMESADVRPDEATLLGIISVCAKLKSSETEQWIDEYVQKNKFGKNTRIANALIDMHSRCGNISRSCRIFEEMPERTLVSWTAMIQGLAMHGYGEAALLRFSQMQREGLRPDEIIFLNVIHACSHAGLVTEGRRCFESMVEEYHLVPWMEHHGSMVDLLCRAGLADEAFEFAMSMPVKPDAVIWRTIVAACRGLGNISLAREALDYLTELEPEYSGNHILKSNLHAMNQEWCSVREVRDDMKSRGLSKNYPGCSFVEGSASV